MQSARSCARAAWSSPRSCRRSARRCRRSARSMSGSTRSICWLTVLLASSTAGLTMKNITAATTARVASPMMRRPRAVTKRKAMVCDLRSVGGVPLSSGVAQPYYAASSRFPHEPRVLLRGLEGGLPGQLLDPDRVGRVDVDHGGDLFELQALVDGQCELVDHLAAGGREDVGADHPALVGHDHDGPRGRRLGPGPVGVGERLPVDLDVVGAEALGGLD